MLGPLHPLSCLLETADPALAMPSPLATAGLAWVVGAILLYEASRLVGFVF